MLSMLNFANQPQQPNMLVSLLPFIVIFVIFYLLLVLPAKNKQKKHQEMIASLKPGAKVITSGGIYGTITGVKDRTFELKVSSNVKIEITKTAIAAVLNDIQYIEEKK